MPLLSVRNLEVHYKVRTGLLSQRATVRAVDGVSIELGAGETLGLVGESGCGKSSLARAVLGLEAAAAGAIEVAGRAVVAGDRSALRRLHQQVQLVFQNPTGALNPRLRVGASVAEPLRAHGRSVPNDVLKTLFADVGLAPELARRFPGALSGGQKQRSVIARSIALNPPLLVCDEPVAALDVSIRAQILNLLMRLQRERNLALLFISHDLGVIRHVSDRVAVMYLGRIVETGVPNEIFSTPRHPYTAALVDTIPKVRRDRKRPRRIIRGEPPSPIARPVGCSFQGRCPFVQARCRQEDPELVDAGNGAQVACFFPLAGTVGRSISGTP